MALPSSGPLSMQDIATEFSQGSSNMSLYTFGSTLPTPTVTSNIELANVFSDSSCSTTLDPGCYKMGNGNVMVIEGNSGVVDSIEGC